MRKAAVVVIVGLAAGPSAADTPQDTPAAIEVDREAPPPGRAELGFDGGAPVDGWAVGLGGGYLSAPLTLQSAAGESRPIRRRETLSLGAALGLGESVVVDARMSLAHQVGDRLISLGDRRPLDRWVPGDLRLGGRIRVVNTAHADALIRADLVLPTGDDHDLAGEPSWMLAWSLIGRFRLPAGIVVAATGGIRLRGAEVILADKLVGDELHGGLGIVVPLPPIHPLWCVREQVKLTAEVVGTIGDQVGDASGPSPAEARVGIVTWPLETLSIGVRVGTGLADEIGAPAFRAMIELTYHGAGRLIPPASAEDAAADEPIEP